VKANQYHGELATVDTLTKYLKALPKKAAEARTLLQKAVDSELLTLRDFYSIRQLLGKASHTSYQIALYQWPQYNLPTDTLLAYRVWGELEAAVDRLYQEDCGKVYKEYIKKEWVNK
jgi:hypothetical protein